MGTPHYGWSLGQVKYEAEQVKERLTAARARHLEATESEEGDEGGRAWMDWLVELERSNLALADALIKLVDTLGAGRSIPSDQDPPT